MYKVFDCSKPHQSGCYFNLENHTRNYSRKKFSKEIHLVKHLLADNTFGKH